MKSIFVSHVHEDNKYLKKMKTWKTKGMLDEYTLSFETEDKRIEGTSAIKNYLKNKIKGSAVVLVLIGDNTHNHNWIKIEVELANNFNKKLCCVRIPNTSGKKPSILNNYKELKFDSEHILKELKK